MTTINAAPAETKPTILQIVPSLDTGGAERSAVEIAEAIVKAGGRALVASSGGRMEEALVAAGGELIRFPAATKNPFEIARNVRRLNTLAREHNVALLHARSRAPAWSARLSATQLGIPFVTTYHGAYNETGPFKRAYNRIMARGDVIIANSHYTANLIKSRYNTKPERIRVIYRGLDPKFDPDKVSMERQQALRDVWGVTSGQRVVLLAARLTGWKGQAVLIDAIGLLHRAGCLPEDVRVILAGDAQGRGAYLADLKRRIQGSGCADRIGLVGHIEDMPAAFSLAHVSVVASIEPEAFGRSGAESQAMGCPVIATRLGAPPETVLAPPEVDFEASTGWLIAPADAQGLADALANAFSLEKAARDAMGVRARQHVMAKFTLTAMQRQTLAIYDDLLGSSLEAAYLGASPQQHSTPDSGAGCDPA